MLSKAIKHEFKATARIFLPVYAAMLLMAVIVSIFYSVDLRSDNPRVIVTMLMVMVFTAAWIITFVIILRRFWTNLLGREGYLTNVLPVRAWQQVFAKLLAAAVWTIGAGIISAAALLLILAGVSDLHGVFVTGFEYIPEVIDELRRNGLMGQSVLAAVLIALNALFAVLSNILQCYTAMSVGQLFNKHRVWASIGVYFGISVVLSIFISVFPSSWLNIFFGASDSLRAAAATINGLLGAALAVEVVQTAIFFAAPSLIIKYRLNLQ